MVNLENRLHLDKWVTNENGSSLEKLVTLRKMCQPRKVGHTWKNGSHLEKCVTLEKWVTLGNMDHTRKMLQTWKYGSHLKKWVILEKWVTLGKKGLP